MSEIKISDAQLEHWKGLDKDKLLEHTKRLYIIAKDAEMTANGLRHEIADLNARLKRSKGDYKGGLWRIADRLNEYEDGLEDMCGETYGDWGA